MLPKGARFSKLEPYLLPLIVVLVGVGAFGLGRLSYMRDTTQALRVVYPDGEPARPLASTAAVAAAAPAPVKAGEGAYVASKNGSKYYLTTCSSANRIKQENRVYFVTAKDALAAGYEAAANCPGL